MIVSFCGHRPNKIGGYKLPNPMYVDICRDIDWLLRELNPDKVITGMALGVDQWAAYIAYKLKIPFIAAIPFEGQELAWPGQSQRTYNILRKLADKEVIVSEGGYSAEKMQTRNKWMVDHCNTLIAIFDGSKGGTGNCVNYAQSINKNIYLIDPAKFKENET
jgi:uncharacterized phage-like protein YoqJ